jgi:threonine synthase
MFSPEIVCVACGYLYPEASVPFVCPVCGGLFDYANQPTFEAGKVDVSRKGMWRYAQSFGFPSSVEQVSLGEGNTPLLWSEAFGRRIAVKCEYLNPTGSFKDRGSSLLVSWMKQRSIRNIVEDSSGNAGASLAAYARKAGIKAQIFVPASASGPKRRQIEALGAKVVAIPGTRADVASAVRQAITQDTVYASHAYLPINLPGYASIAYEIYEQLGNRMPGTVIVPAGQGGLLLGVYRGFDALRIASRDRLNRTTMVGVQIKSCAPLWRLFVGNERAEKSSEVPTLAEGVKVRTPVRYQAVLAAVRSSNGWFHVTDEEGLQSGLKAFSQLGFYVEPTSAILWDALLHNHQRMLDPVVMVLTGSGYKYSG